MFLATLVTRSAGWRRFDWALIYSCVGVLERPWRTHFLIARACRLLELTANE